MTNSNNEQAVAVKTRVNAGADDWTAVTVKTGVNAGRNPQSGLPAGQ
jgi:hypothetical protein